MERRVPWRWRAFGSVIVALAIIAPVTQTAPARASSPAPATVDTPIPTHSAALVQLPQVVNTASMPASSNSAPTSETAEPAPLLDNRQTVTSPPIPNSGALADAPSGSGGSSGVQPLNTTVKTGFTGIADTGHFPADSNGAAGTSDVVETVNQKWQAFTQAGAAETNLTDLPAWFSTQEGLTDPHVVFDSLFGRYVMVDLGPEGIWLSTSQQSGAVGNWCNYHFDGRANGAFPSNYSADYPSIGLSVNFVNVSMNIFDGSGNFQYSRIFTIDRSTVESCQTTSWVYWYNLSDPQSGVFGTDVNDQAAFTISPAEQDQSANATYLIDSYSGGGCNMTLWTMVGTTVAQTNLGLTGQKISTQCYSSPVTGQQKGSSVTVGGGDARIRQAELRNNVLSFSLGGSYNWNCDGADDVAYWFNVNPTGGQIVSQGILGAPCYYYYFPAMQTMADGSFIIAYDYSSTNDYLSEAVIGYDTHAAPESNLTVAGGSGPYTTTGGASCGCARWGDYSSARIDPSNGQQAWAVGEFATASNTWGTNISVSST